MTKLSEFTMNSIAGEPVDFAQFDGQIALIVNVASN
jgi:glutathione peroxidase-family protein